MIIQPARPVAFLLFLLLPLHTSTHYLSLCPSSPQKVVVFPSQSRNGECLSPRFGTAASQIPWRAEMTKYTLLDNLVYNPFSDLFVKSFSPTPLGTPVVEGSVQKSKHVFCPFCRPVREEPYCANRRGSTSAISSVLDQCRRHGPG